MSDCGILKVSLMKSEVIKMSKRNETDDFNVEYSNSDDFEAYFESLDADYDEIERIENMMRGFDNE